MKTPKLKIKLLRMFRKRFYIIEFGKHFALLDNKELKIITSIPYTGGRPFYTRQEAMLHGITEPIGFWEFVAYYKIRKRRQYRLELLKTGIA